MYTYVHEEMHTAVVVEMELFTFSGLVPMYEKNYIPMEGQQKLKAEVLLPSCSAHCTLAV